MIEQILKQILLLEEDSLYEFYKANPVCSQDHKGDWFYPKLCSFFYNRECSDEIKNLLKKLGDELHFEAMKIPMWELLAIDKSQAIDDSYVEDFIRMLQSFESEDYHFQKIKSPYKTIQYSMALKNISKNDVMSLMNKFGSYDHPYILAEISNTYILSGDFISGLNLLYRTIVQILQYPNIYWNSEYGIMGCANTFRHLFIMYKSLNNADFDIILNFLKLYFLFTTRLTKVAKDYVVQITAYANRADIAFNSLSQYIFPLGFDRKLLYISDLYCAHSCNEFAPQYSEMTGNRYLTKSLTYYQNGSLWPNDTGGYVDADDRTYGEIVQIKQIQALDIANAFLSSYKQGAFLLDRKKLNELFRNLSKEILYNYSSFKDKVLNFKK